MMIWFRAASVAAPILTPDQILGIKFNYRLRVLKSILFLS